jgi:two-component system, NarL family, sensor histidine kinase UhpB
MNLKLHLLIRMSLMGLLCWLGVSIYLVAQSGRRAAQELVSSADQLQPIVAADVMRRWISLDSDARFPDLGGAAARFPTPMCLRYSARDGSSSASGCGDLQVRATVPHFASRMLNALVPGRISLARQITAYGQSVGTLQLEADDASLLERQWSSVRELLGLTAVTVLVLDLLVFWVIGRALRPAARIVAVVELLGESMLAKPLPLFRPREFALIANGINRLADRLRRSNAARAELTTRLIKVQEDERRELALELHGEFGQCVAALGAVSASVRQSVLAGELLTEADVMPLELGVERMLLSLRGMLQRMSLPSLQPQGLRSALADLITAWQSRFHGGFRLILDADEAADRIPGYDSSLCVYRAVQECLSNIARHAPATGEAIVRLRHDGDKLRLRVSNELAEMSQGQGHAGTGMGLKLLSERVRSLGGDCSVEVTATQFIVDVYLPMVTQ